ncbi:MAG TPA: flagellar hook-basal body complex protein FliE [Nitrospiraceae bacterium]|nr:flagellar hook-basal body complex protein FliE [Nitrospiraceae bacterium]
MDPTIIQGISPSNLQEAATPSGPASRGGSQFLDSLKSAISQVNDVQLEAGRAVDALMTGQTENVHQTMVALQKADASFQLMMQVRNKLVAAYEEINRMQI